MDTLLTTTAVAEAATGLGMLASPSLVTSLILGSPPETAVASAVARVAGVALLALGAACWLARHDERTRAARGLVVAMLLYNAGISAVLVQAALGVGVSGIALWPTVVLHTAFGVWCITSLRARRP